MTMKNIIFILLLLFEQQYFFKCNELNSSRKINGIVSLDTNQNNANNTNSFPLENYSINEDADVIIDIDLPIMKWFGKLLDHHEWTANYLNNVESTCRKNLLTYLKHLQNGTLWALKMNDASGKYSGEFFFGNNFWIGSKSLCYELENKQYNVITPPFEVYFYIAKLRIHLVNITSTARSISVGLCLPKSCTPTNIQTMLNKHISKSKKLQNFETSLEIISVRPVPGEFSVFRETTFYIVTICSIILTILIAAGTFYEYTMIQNKKNGNALMQISTFESSEENSSDTSSMDDKNSKEFNNQYYDKKDMSFVNTIIIQTNSNTRNNDNKNINSSTEQFVVNTDENKNSKKDFALQILLCFSAISNGKKILSFETPNADSITCVHGLRFLSLCWVILVHTCLFVYGFSKNMTFRHVTERYFLYQTVSNATFSVDTFFFISGLLLTVLYYRAEDKKKPNSSLTPHRPTENPKQEDQRIQKFSYTIDAQKFSKMLFYRFVRLTPAYMFILCVYDILVKYVANDSVFDVLITRDIRNCDYYWWRNLLYINNLFPMSEICMIWTWYMANDMQFYVVGIILVLISIRSMRLAFGLLLVILISSWNVTFAISNHYSYHARVEKPFDLFDQLYDKPWTRIGPYLTGMITGWIIYKFNLKTKISKTLIFLFWPLSLLCLGSLVYGLGETGLKPPYSFFYVALGHTAWAIGIGWITIACSMGYGFFVNSLLSFRGFLPFSRLVYCAYLIHLVVICVMSHVKDGPAYLDYLTVIILVCGNIAISFFFSFVISIAFEAPVVRLLQILMKK